MKTPIFFNQRQLIQGMILKNYAEFFHLSAQRKELPKAIGSFTFVKPFVKNSKRRSAYQYGIYKDKKGRQALAKVWTGKFKDFDYQLLSNEAVVTQFLNAAVAKAKRSIPAHLAYIRFPKVYEVSHSDTHLAVLFEYCTGEELASAPATKQSTIYADSVALLQLLGSYFSPEEKKVIGTRSGISYLLLYPFSLLKALISHPTAAGKLLEASGIVLKNYSSLLSKHDTLAHRDLHTHNILFDNHTATVLDSSLATYTFNIYDVIATMAVSTNASLQNDLAQKLFGHRNSALIQTLSAVHVTHLFTDPALPKAKQQSALKLLELAHEKRNYRTPSFLSKAIHIPLGYFLDAVFSWGKKPQSLPDSIRTYSLVKNLQKETTHPFAIGLYKDNTGEEVVAKIWQGNWKTVHYFALLHEIVVLQTLNTMSKRLKKSLISFPRLVDAWETNGQVVLLTTYHSGATGSVTDYETVRKSLAQYAAVATKAEMAAISHKGFWQYLLLYPLVLFAAVIRSPANAGLLLSGIPTFCKGIPALFRSPANGLVHGDLHPHNMAVSKNSVVVFDSEQMIFTYPIYELINSLSSKYTTEDFAHFLVSKLAYFSSKSKQNKLLVEALHVMCSTYNFSGYLAESNQAIYKNVLQRRALI